MVGSVIFFNIIQCFNEMKEKKTVIEISLTQCMFSNGFSFIDLSPVNPQSLHFQVFCMLFSPWSLSLLMAIYSEKQVKVEGELKPDDLLLSQWISLSFVVWFSMMCH